MAGPGPAVGLANRHVLASRGLVRGDEPPVQVAPELPGRVVGDIEELDRRRVSQGGQAEPHHDPADPSERLGPDSGARSISPARM